MLTPDLLHDYQKRAVNFQCSMPETALWLDPGLGKTVTTLTSAAHLLNTGFLRGVLVVAPIRVCRLVWKQESKKWAHLQYLNFMLMTGTRDQRTRVLLKEGTHIWLINYENLGCVALFLHLLISSHTSPSNGKGLSLAIK